MRSDYHPLAHAGHPPRFGSFCFFYLRFIARTLRECLLCSHNYFSKRQAHEEVHNVHGSAMDQEGHLIEAVAVGHLTLEPGHGSQTVKVLVLQRHPGTTPKRHMCKYKFKEKFKLLRTQFTDASNSVSEKLTAAFPRKNSNRCV